MTRLCILVFILIGMTGCAEREPSSTDHHYINNLSCGIVKYHGNMHKMCCRGEHCYIMD